MAICERCFMFCKQRAGLYNHMRVPIYASLDQAAAQGDAPAMNVVIPLLALITLYSLHAQRMDYVPAAFE